MTSSMVLTCHLRFTNVIEPISSAQQPAVIYLINRIPYRLLTIAHRRKSLRHVLLCNFLINVPI